MLNYIAVIFRAQGNHAKALEHLEQGLAICQQLDDKAGEMLSRQHIASACYYSGDLAKAEEHISQAAQLAEQIGGPDLQRLRKMFARARAMLRRRRFCPPQRDVVPRPWLM
jgi:tetratricopeptide (TPR) repeat protein